MEALNVVSAFVFSQEVSLGQGSFTRIFKGYKTDVHNGEKHVTEVLLKELDVAHKNSWEVRTFRHKYFSKTDDYTHPYQQCSWIYLYILSTTSAFFGGNGLESLQSLGG